MGFFNNPLGTLESWGKQIAHDSEGFFTNLGHGNIGAALGNLAGLSTNLTPWGAAFNAFTGGHIEKHVDEGVSNIADGIWTGNVSEIASGVTESVFASSPGLNLVDAIFHDEPLHFVDDVLGLPYHGTDAKDAVWPELTKLPCKPSADSLKMYQRANRLLVALSQQHNNGGPVIRQPAWASTLSQNIINNKTGSLPNQSDCQWTKQGFTPAPADKSIWNLDDTLQAGQMLAFGIPEAGVFISGGISALSILKRNMAAKHPEPNSFITAINNATTQLEQHIDNEHFENIISQATSRFSLIRDQVVTPFANAMHPDATFSKTDILSGCEEAYHDGLDWLTQMMYEYTPVSRNMAVPPTFSEYAFRAWIDCANTYLFAMKIGCILTAIKDISDENLSDALKKINLVTRICDDQESYKYYVRINMLLGSTTGIFRKHMQTTLNSMHQKLGKRLNMIGAPIEDAGLHKEFHKNWKVSIDSGLGADGFITGNINWDRAATVKKDHLVDATKVGTSKPVQEMWQKSGAFAVGETDSCVANTNSYAQYVINHYADAYNYSLGTDADPSSMLELVVKIADHWWATDSSLWATFTRSIAMHQSYVEQKIQTAQTTGDTKAANHWSDFKRPFWEGLSVPGGQTGRNVLSDVLIHVIQGSSDAHKQGAAGMDNAGKTAQQTAAVATEAAKNASAYRSG